MNSRTEAFRVLPVEEMSPATDEHDVLAKRRLQELAQSYAVSGSSNQPSINGVYALCKSCRIFGHAYYTKGTDTSKRFLYWTPNNKGKWVIADDTAGRVFRALEPDGATPTFGTPAASGWYSWNKKWIVESSVAVKTPSSPPMAQTNMICKHGGKAVGKGKALVKEYSRALALFKSKTELARMNWHGSKGKNSVSLASSSIGDIGAQAIVEWLPNTAVTDLDLQNNKISDVGAAMIAAALPNSKLTKLILGSNPISDVGAVKIAAALPKSKLTWLNLNSNQISDAGAAKIAEALPGSNLTALALNTNTISDVGAGKIAAALPNSTLTILGLGNNRISDAGAVKLIAALPNSKLTKL